MDSETTFNNLVDGLESLISCIDEYSDDDRFLKVRELLIKAQDLTHTLAD